MKQKLTITVCVVLAVVLLGGLLFLTAGPGLLESETDWVRGAGLTALRCRVNLGMAGPGDLREAIGSVHRLGGEDDPSVVAQIDALVLAGYEKLGASEKEQFLRGLEGDILASWDLSSVSYFSLTFFPPVPVSRGAGRGHFTGMDGYGYLTDLWPSLSLDFLKEGLASNDPGVRALVRVIAESRADTLLFEDKRTLVTYAFDEGMARRDRQIIDDAMATADALGVHLEEVWESRKHELEGPAGP